MNIPTIKINCPNCKGTVGLPDKPGTSTCANCGCWFQMPKVGDS